MLTVPCLLGWIKQNNPRLRKTRAVNLARAIWQLAWVRQPVLSAMARVFVGRIRARYQLKRLWRFLHNPKVSANGLLWPTIAWVWSMLGRPDPWIWVVDWTMFDARTVPRRRWQILTISAVGNGTQRAVPLALCLADRDAIGRSQPWLERQALLGALRHAPEGVRIIVVADRGFESNETLEWLVRQEIGFVVRLTKKRVFFDHALSPPRRTYLRALEHPPAQGLWFADVSVGLYHDRPRKNRLSVAVARGPGQSQPWFLVTNLPSFGATVETYFLRMQAEELHRDLKQVFQLRRCQILSLHAFENLLAAIFLTIQQLTALAFTAVEQGYIEWTNVRSHKDISFLNLAFLVLFHQLTPAHVRSPPLRETG